jgi:hypothetical protein
MENYIDQTVVEDIMSRVGGAIFTVKFRKSNGALRKINGRLEVTKFLKGGVKTTDDRVYQTIFDNTKKAYRCFPLSKVLELKALGQTFTPTMQG